MQIQKLALMLVLAFSFSIVILAARVSEEAQEAAKTVNEKVEATEAIASEATEKKAEPKKKKSYQGDDLIHPNMIFFDNVISLTAPDTVAELTLILTAAEDVLRHAVQKTLVNIDESRDGLVKTFEKFAAQIQDQSKYILPVLDESLEISKLAKLGITLIDGKSLLRAYATGKEKPSVFFKEHIKTEEQLFQFAAEMFVFLKDFKHGLKKTRGAYKRELERKKQAKEEIERGEKEPLYSV